MGVLGIAEALDITIPLTEFQTLKNTQGETAPNTHPYASSSS